MLLSRRSRDRCSRSTSRYRKGWAPPTSQDDTATGSYTGWSRRDTRGAGSSGSEDKYATWRGAKEAENENDTDKEVRKEKEMEVIVTKSWLRRDNTNQCRSRLRRETMWCQVSVERGQGRNLLESEVCRMLQSLSGISGQAGVLAWLRVHVEMNQYSSHARHVTSSTTLTREYRDLLSYVTFLLLCCQLRVNSGEFNSLTQFSVLSVLCSARCMSLLSAGVCRVGCSSETLTHCVHIPQALSLDKAKMSQFV